MQPLFINLTGKKIVIAGGGKIAARKARSLNAEHAVIVFISPEFCEDVIAFSEEIGCELICRKAKLDDFNHAFLVILATNDRETNRTFACQLSLNHLVCVADNAEEGNVTFPATIKRGELQIAVTTNGASPKLTRRLKQSLELQFDQSWEEYISFLSQCRRKIKELDLLPEDKNNLLEELLDEQYRTNQCLRDKFLLRICSV
ncbi:bifunctional precorrin-2 dehydrogenase/sirohydrochlorin ferrochelatase [Neobacillus mesonae]|uniref:precorrin-2 dehydrogenase/sirohydrochlorin ferrochelatase family protein n=1 Tax=Neobacillus mesonae TaxID=1193713 RepID=UPI00203C5EFA|nr:NAD(P)-dependent oxidoreductase [Neobacillus mesonae]MCM3570860.1 potassium transporter Trk [Neobacillus mesonae]